MITQKLHKTDAFLENLKDPILLTKAVLIRNLCNDDEAFFHSFQNLNFDQIRRANESLSASNVRKEKTRQKIGYSIENVK